MRLQADCGYDMNIHGQLHNMGQHDEDEEIRGVRNEKQVLLSMEACGGFPVSLDKIAKKSIDFQGSC